MHLRSLGLAALVTASMAGCDVAPRPGEGGGDEPAARAAAGAEAEMAEVRAVIQRYNAATEVRDSTAIRDLILDDGRFVWFEQGEARYRSADEIVAGLRTFPPDQSIRTTLDSIRVVPLGEGAARAWTTFETIVGDGDIRFSGLITFVLERTADGWRIAGGQSS
ncbi:MAG TPA: DUF4440 domain-containing protein [Longimicrobiales bacterium]|nr:DUF4440 domain-containing protein [Longimicrobiales bacterium]